MTIRSVPVGSGRVVDVSLHDHLSVLRVGEDDRRRMVDALCAAGFDLVSAEDLPAPSPVAAAAFESVLRNARLGVEVSIAFLDAAAADRRRVDERIVAARNELDQVRRRVDGLGELHDLMIEELGRGPVPIGNIGDGWALVATRADRSDLAGLAAGVRAWIGAAHAGTAPRHSVHPDCYDVPAVLDGAPTRVAAEAAVATQRLGEVQVVLDQLALERAVLDDEIERHAVDLDVATRLASSASEHVERVERRLGQAGEVIERVLASKGTGGVVVDAELEWLAAEPLLDSLDRSATKRQVVFLATRGDLPADRVSDLRPNGPGRSRRARR
jgi:hypothetical protein